MDLRAAIPYSPLAIGPGRCPILHEPERPRMRLSAYFLPTLKENPNEAQIVSHRLMLRAGMIRQTSAGIYAWLPLGFRVLKRSSRSFGKSRTRQARRNC